mgnify:CR=1 FL=1
MNDATPIMTDDELQDAIDDALIGIGNDRKARFVRAYVRYGDIYKAGLKAEYGANSKSDEQRKRTIQQHCSKILKEPKVDRAYRLMMQQVNRNAVMDVEEWVRENVKFYRECREMVNRVVLDKGEAIEIDQKDHRNAAAAGAALDRLGKHLGAYKPIEIKHDASESLRKILSDIDGSTTGLPSQSD